MDQATIERALRAGPPEEDGYADDRFVFEPAVTATTVEPVTRVLRGSRDSRARTRLQPLGLIAAALLVAVAAFGGATAGRLAAPGGQAGAATSSPLLAPAFVAPPLRKAYEDLVSSRSWMACAVDVDVACSALTWSTTSNGIQVRLPVVDPTTTTTVRGRHLVVGARFDPALLPTAYLIRVGVTPPAQWVTPVTVAMGDGGWLLDLPSVEPGTYIVALHSDQVDATGTYRVAAIRVEAP